MPKNRTEQPWERQKGESPQAFAAFLVYLQMGSDRSIRATSQKLAKSRTIIDRWSRTYGWVERCRAWDNYLQQEAKKAAVAEIRKMNRQHIALAQQIQSTAMQALQELGSNMVNPKNFAAVVKLATDLERQGMTAEMKMTAEMDEAGGGGPQREDDPLTRSIKEALADGIL